jgi:abortive infection bacteriophage resistance protein
VKLHDSRQIICRCRLDQKESATPVPVNIDKNGVKNYRSSLKERKRASSIHSTIIGTENESRRSIWLTAEIVFFANLLVHFP